MEIVKILSVVDTRDYEEGPDGRFRPVPGSGDSNACARCGRDHEVHATVELADGTAAVVGTGCMARESLELASRVKSAESAAKTLRRARAELAVAQAAWQACSAARAEVEALEAPEPVEFVSGQWREIRVGDGCAVIQPWTKADERIECARRNWRSNRLRELGFTGRERAPTDLVERVAKLEAKLAALVAA